LSVRQSSADAVVPGAKQSAAAALADSVSGAGTSTMVAGGNS